MSLLINNQLHLCYLFLTASTAFLSDSQPSGRKALAMYPLFLFYFIIGWLIISHTRSWKKKPDIAIIVNIFIVKFLPSIHIHNHNTSVWTCPLSFFSLSSWLLTYTQIDKIVGNAWDNGKTTLTWLLICNIFHVKFSRVKIDIFRENDRSWVFCTASGNSFLSQLLFFFSTLLFCSFTFLCQKL